MPRFGASEGRRDSTGGWRNPSCAGGQEEDDVSFMQSPDWDTAPEPIISSSVKVVDGKAGPIRKESQSNPTIYHGKGFMVKDDYPGFDKQESIDRYNLWNERNVPEAGKKTLSAGKNTGKKPHYLRLNKQLKSGNSHSRKYPRRLPLLTQALRVFGEPQTKNVTVNQSKSTDSQNLTEIDMLKRQVDMLERQLNQSILRENQSLERENFTKNKSKQCNAYWKPQNLQR